MTSSFSNLPDFRLLASLTNPPPSSVPEVAPSQGATPAFSPTFTDKDRSSCSSRLGDAVRARGERKCTDAVGAGAERKCADAVGNGLRRKVWQRQHSKDLPVNQQVGQGLWNRSTIPEQSLEKGKGKGFAFNKSLLLCEQGSNLCVVRVRQLVNSRKVYSAARSTSTPSASCSTTKQDSNGWHLLCHFIDRGGG